MKKFLVTTIIILSFFLAGEKIFAAEDENFEDLQKFQKEMEQTVQKIQKMTQAGFAKSGGTSGSTGDSQLMNIEHWRLKFFHLLNDQKFVDDINKIWNHPQRNYVFYTQLGLFLFMIFFKAWRKSKAKNWFTSIWVSFYCFVLFWGLSLFLIPLVMFGEPFQAVLATLWKTILA